MKRYLLKKSVVLGLIIILAAGFTLMNIVPQDEQAGLNTGGHPGAYSSLISLAVRSAGLNHVLSAWWFLLAAGLFLLSLILSTESQFKAVRARIRMAPQGTAGQAQEVSAPLELITETLRKEGYRELARTDSCVRYGKATLGHGGAFLLHLGITVTVFFSLVYLLTEHRVLIQARSGDLLQIAGRKYPEKKGVLSGGLPLPKAVYLESVEPEYWDNDQLKALSSALTVIDEKDQRERLRISLSDRTSYKGMIVYQRNSFGNFFLLHFQDNNGAFTVPLMLPMPKDRKSAGYGDMDLDNGRFILKAKYFLNADHKSMSPTDPVLVLRLYDKEKLVKETVLMMNGTDALGPYTIKLEDIGWWADLLFEGSRGMTGIFAGFFLLLLGGVLGYFFVPREVLICRTEKGYNISWKAPKFEDFYREEAERILSLARGDQ